MPDREALTRGSTRRYDNALRRLDADIGSALLSIEEAQVAQPTEDVNVLNDVAKRLRLAGRGVDKLWKRHGLTEFGRDV